jgi:hypothetical protein
VLPGQAPEMNSPRMREFARFLLLVFLEAEWHDAFHPPVWPFEDIPSRQQVFYGRCFPWRSPMGVSWMTGEEYDRWHRIMYPDGGCARPCCRAGSSTRT